MLMAELLSIFVFNHIMPHTTTFQPQVTLIVYGQEVDCGGVDTKLAEEMNRVRNALKKPHPGLTETRRR